jgi:hypothetical protein
MGVQRQADLLQVVPALGAPAGFPRSLDRRHQHRYEDTDDRDHDKKLNERKPARLATP